MQEIETYSSISKFRNALYEIPFSGSSGGIVADLSQLSDND